MAKALSVSVNFLYPGIMLKGDAYTEQGEKVQPGFVPFTDEKIAELKARGITTIYYTPHPEPTRFPGSEPIIPQETINKGLEIAKEVERRLKENAPLPVREINTLIDEFVEKVVALQGNTLNLAELRDYDDYTYTHSLNVALLSLLMGKKLSYTEDQLKILGVGGMLHDIGKVKIPKEILNKPDRLTPQEFDIMKRHPVYGFEIVKDTYSRFVQSIVLYHHEKINGSGYPLGKKNNEMGEFAQIASLCDVFDAITSARSYKPAQPFWYALLCIYREQGKSFSPRLAQIFLKELPQYFGNTPIFSKGSFVLLNTGEIAYVPEDSRTLWPQVWLLINSRKEISQRKVILDLSLEENRMIERQIFDEKLTATLQKIVERYLDKPEKPKDWNLK
ncbi:HD-GYP domain-containing protein [Thermospira aquatica]|uniref:HD-GYP domain-containing protein n=1 Tax=Thermospira aquatica TaxID=2828656 RepID=A0AAX3BF47_9SPIR|nr:HD-GYP domain-containing protein [Thermospira aquatica]URA10758.1 HD-GYP domain-containing protein [Thermospira aquatica]